MGLPYSLWPQMRKNREKHSTADPNPPPPPHTHTSTSTHPSLSLPLSSSSHPLPTGSRDPSAPTHQISMLIANGLSRGGLAVPRGQRGALLSWMQHVCLLLTLLAPRGCLVSAVICDVFYSPFIPLAPHLGSILTSCTLFYVTKQHQNTGVYMYFSSIKIQS